MLRATSRDLTHLSTIMNILLIGARASGKTTIGRLLAERTDRAFVDLDDSVRASFARPTIQQVWAEFGEAAWRQAELAALTTLLREDGRIIALGGGAPAIPQARALIDDAARAHRARVIYLRCDSARLAERLRRNPGDRPSLTGRSPADEIAETLQARAPIYEALATHVFDCGSMTPAQIAESLLHAV